ncbi:E3 ubiquitin-protein ligase RNF130-like [Mercenaria mercenaria]|uniref:E3 ubiquitin-protein ligase RNF130-like n=1 Tax=Mercenaria mercenaria TaxID=6596 RepID=UPI00234F1CA0|nr:E3 ubiquitin-protein ligase RNF130-like [Mercenaria mercenaria]
MEFFTHNRIFFTRWRPKMDVCIFYVYLYVLLSCPFVICTHEVHHTIEKAKISISYVNELGSYQEVDQFDFGNYGEHSLVNKASPVKGQLVQVQTLYNKSELGCSPLDPAIIPNDEPWIALVKRGTCNFNEKVYYAKILKALAVIVYDNKSLTEDGITMDIKGKHSGRYM